MHYMFESSDGHIVQLTVAVVQHCLVRTAVVFTLSYDPEWELDIQSKSYEVGLSCSECPEGQT